MATEQAAEPDLFLGFDLSTQQLKAVAVSEDLKQAYAATVDFDVEYSAKYGTTKGTLTNPAEGEIYMPVAMWLEAIDLVLSRLRDDGLDFARVKALSGAGMQHGTVFWSHDAEALLAGLDASRPLVDQLPAAFSHPHSPNWQDSSTQAQCDAFNAALPARPGSSSEQALADLTGSQAHHRFSGPQVMRFRTKHAAHYAATARVSLVSSFIASVFLGRVAPIDIADACGMNLWDIQQGRWDARLLALAAGSAAAAPCLEAMLGDVPEDGGATLGMVSNYFRARYGFGPACAVAPSTGDNPATILALPLHAGDAIVSLGTSTTFLTSTPSYGPDPSFHVMNHPASAGLYMFMLCYKNGALAREHVRDALNGDDSRAWDAFDGAAVAAPPLGVRPGSSTGRLGLYFPLHEIVPSVPPGRWEYDFDSDTGALAKSATSTVPAPTPATDARSILESQFLSLRLRSSTLAHAQSDGKLPPQPRRVYLVGGGSVNAAIAQLAGSVLGGAEGVFRLELGGNACALGAAYKAAWAARRRVHDATGEVRGGRDTEGFEAFVGERWDEGAFVRRVDQGYRPGLFEMYGRALPAFAEMERRVLAEVSTQGARRRDSVSYGTQAPAAGPV